MPADGGMDLTRRLKYWQNYFFRS